MRDRILAWLGLLAWRRPFTIVGAAIALAIASGLYAHRVLVLNADTDDLIAPDRPFMAEYRRFLAEFGDLEYIYVVVEDNRDPQRTQQVVDHLISRLRQISDGPPVHGAIEPHEQLRIATRAMPEQDLRALVTAGGAFPALLSGDTGIVLREASSHLATLIQRGAQMAPEEQGRHGAAAVFLLNSIAVSRQPTADSPLSFLLPQHQQREYFPSDTGRFYFIWLMPDKDYRTLAWIEEPLRQIRAAIDEVRAEYPDVDIGITGKPVLQADEMRTSNRDMTRAAILAFVLCSGLFMLSFGGIRKPLLAVVAFACGAAWTYGYTTAVVGQLNLLSIVFILILVGVGMDYGVHMLSRYREYRATRSVRAAILDSVLNAGRGNLTGALTSSAVFFMALLTNFQGLRELGVIAGGGLLLCVLAMTLVLPALLTIFNRHRTDVEPYTSVAEKAEAKVWRGLHWVHEHPRTVLTIAALSTLGLLVAPGHRRFEYNLLELQALGLESVKWEHRILEDSAAASWFGAVIVESQEEALDVIERARHYPSIGAVRSVFDVIEPLTAERQRLRDQLREKTAQPVAPGPDAVWTIEDLQRPLGPLNLIAAGAARQAPEEAQHLQQIGEDLQALADEMAQNEQSVRARIDGNIAAIAGSLQLMLEADAMPLRDALPDALRQQYISPIGKYLVMLHADANVWEYEPMAQFIADLRAIDPDVTGTPITHFESLGDMQDAFLRMAGLSLLVIALLVWLDFRHFKYMLLAVMPTVLGLVWLVEAMALLNISFNLANFFSVPILIGLSVDSAVHILHRYREGGPTRLELGATRRAVVVTALTTTIGFGSIMLAEHRGLRSLGQVMAMGSILCLVATIIVLPAVLAWLEKRKGLS